MKLKRVARTEDLNNSLLLANHANDGDICIVEETHEAFEFKDGKWIPYLPTAKGKGPEISLYELNRSIIRQLPNYEISQMKEFINEFNQYHEKIHNRYYMLLSVETSYYTVFVNNQNETNDLKDLGSALLAVSLAIGPIVSHDVCEDHIEIWFRNKDDNEVYCYMLFPYDGGVVPFG